MLARALLYGLVRVVTRSSDMTLGRICYQRERDRALDARGPFLPALLEFRHGSIASR